MAAKALGLSRVLVLLLYQGTTVATAPAPAAAPAEAVKPAKSKKLLIIVVVALVIVAGGAFAAWKYVQSTRAAADAADGQEVVHAHVEAKGPPTFLPLENMVVNLADPGGERMAQIGITISLADAHAADKVKAYLPIIRSEILKLIAAHTSVELLTREGKDTLEKEIMRAVSKPLGFDVEADAEPAQKKSAKKTKADPAEDNPVQGVLFSSFIVQ